MYSIILKNGKTVTINATTVEWYQTDKMLRFLHKNNIVARINMDSIIGWAKTDHIVKSEEDEK